MLGLGIVFMRLGLGLGIVLLRLGVRVRFRHKIPEPGRKTCKKCSPYVVPIATTASARADVHTTSKRRPYDLVAKVLLAALQPAGLSYPDGIPI